MRYITNVYYRLCELFARVTGDSISAEYYAAKREDNK